MQYLTLLITLPLTVIAVLVVLSNGADVSLHFFPDDKTFTLTAPLWQIVLGFLLAGFLFGALFVWILHQKARFRYWQESRKTVRLEKELEKLHAEDIIRQDRAAAGVVPSSSGVTTVPAHITAPVP